VRRLHDQKSSLPPAIRLPHHIWNTDGSVWPGQDAGFLGRANDPWMFRCEPASPSFQIPEFALPEQMTLARVERRRELLQQIDRLSESLDRGATMGPYDAATRQAFELLTSPESRAAMRLADESAEVRERY